MSSNIPLSLLGVPEIIAVPESSVTGEANKLEHDSATWSGNLYLRDWHDARPIWNNLLQSSRFATLYHKEAWLRVLNKAYGLKLTVAILKRDGCADAGCIFARSSNPFSRKMKALPFSDYCWPLASGPVAYNQFLDSLKHYSEAGCSWEIRGCEGSPQWQTVRCFSTWMLDLTRPLAVIERGLNEAYRRQARRARGEGVQIERGSDRNLVSRFYEMHLRTRRRLGLPAQPMRFFDLVRETFSFGDRFEVWIASRRGEDLAGLIVLIDGKRLYYKWAARLVEGPSGSNHQLVWSLIEEFAGKMETLDLGRTDDRNEGLARFKRHLGAQRVPLPYTFFPKAPREVSSEIAGGTRQMLSSIWRRLPLRVTRTLGGVIYPYLT